VRVRAIVAQQPKAGSGDGTQSPLPQVVLPVAEEREVACRQPRQQLAYLGLLRSPGGGQRGIGQRRDQFPGGAAHPALVFHRHPEVIEHPAQVGLQALLVGDASGLHVDPGLGHPSGGSASDGSAPDGSSPGLARHVTD
jgi:hypothetical protein